MSWSIFFWFLCQTNSIVYLWLLLIRIGYDEKIGFGVQIERTGLFSRSWNPDEFLVMMEIGFELEGVEYFLGNGRDLDVVIKLIWWVCTLHRLKMVDLRLESKVGNIGGEICCGGVIIQ
jgi:hypothetical protein